MSQRAGGAASGYALRRTISANRLNQLPDHQFAQLDKHNFVDHVHGLDPRNCWCANSAEIVLGMPTQRPPAAPRKFDGIFDGISKSQLIFIK